jgi:pSer/pThr/pTyr-binding forkhead associated (FHA) protein
VHALRVGRSGDNELPIERDEYASSHHARFEPRRDGVYVEDVGSTNGTFVNGIRLTRERRLAPGDVVRIGETDLRFES